MYHTYTERKSSEYTGAVIAAVAVLAVIVFGLVMVIEWSQAVQCAVTLAC